MTPSGHPIVTVATPDGNKKIAAIPLWFII